MEPWVSTFKMDLPKDAFPDPQMLKFSSEQSIAELIAKLNNKTMFFKEETQLFRRYTERITQGKGFKAKDRDGQLLLKDSALDADHASSLLTAEQKADIASHEADELRQELVRIDEKAKKYADKYQCRIRECDQFKEFVDLQDKDFKHKILSAKSVGAEWLLKWLEESAKSLESMFRSRKLSNSANMNNIRALQNTLHKQEELGESLTQVDFMKVEIENRLLVHAFDKCKKEIQETNRENNKSALATADLNQKAIEYTKFIQEGQAKIVSESDVLKRLDSESDSIDEAIQKLELWNRIAKEENFRCPSIAVYIHIEREIELLEQLRKDSDRKVQIIEMARRLRSNDEHPARMTQHLEKKLEAYRPTKMEEILKEPYEQPAIMPRNKQGAFLVPAKKNLVY